MPVPARLRQPVRSVAHLPEPLPGSYQNRVRNLSPGNQNQDGKHLPGSHTAVSRLAAVLCCCTLPESRAQPFEKRTS